MNSLNISGLLNKVIALKNEVVGFLEAEQGNYNRLFEAKKYDGYGEKCALTICAYEEVVSSLLDCIDYLKYTFDL